ncbi:MAG: hypothetical protein Ct9H90mP25_2870 [Gammaproteobacteria bacterium]|nr:MAG: hypothetical protein Ct9H90mP25_2870 [Gammaproteobacteria bacterium]
MLSRCLEEGATLSTSLIPWTTSGAFITGVLSISPLEFAPWTFFNYLNPLLSIGLAYLGFGIFRKVSKTHEAAHRNLHKKFLPKFKKLE